MYFRRLLALAPALFLLACSSVSPAPRTISLALRGSVHGGQQPISGSAVQLYAVGLSGGGSASTPLFSTAVATDTGGGFTITGQYTCPTPDSQVYLAAQGGNPGLAPGTTNPAITLAAALGPCGTLSSSTFIAVNEVTTVALAEALAPFASSITAIGSSASDAPLLDAAFTAATRLASTATGISPGVGLPSGFTVPITQINTLANVLAACVNTSGGASGDPSACGQLFSLTTPASLSAPADTFAAALRVADNPALNTANLFNIVTPISPFKPQLATTPTDFAVRTQTSSGLQLSAPSLSFGAVNVGSSAQAQALTITNSSPSAVAINSIALTGNLPADFTVTHNCPASLAPSSSCVLQLGFTPSGGGARIAAVAVANDSPSSMLLAGLSGIGVSQPLVAPALTAVSPATVPVGSSSATFTLTGTGFTPAMQVFAGNSYAAVQYVSPQTATVTLASYMLQYAGNLSFYARTYAGQSNLLNAQVVYPAPTLSSISPGTVQASSPSFTLALSGSNFTSSSTVNVNGVSHTAEFNTPTSISVIVNPSEIATPGSLNVSVVTPSPGGGTSSSQQLQVIPAPNRMRSLNYAAADMVSDPVRPLLYASVPAYGAQTTNTIIAIDPVQGAVTTTATLTDAPDRLAISDDGSFLYVSLKAAGKITRLTLPSLAPDITWSLPSNVGASDLAVAPGTPHTLAVSTLGGSFGARTVTIYDDAVARSLQPSASYAEPTFETLAWGADASTLYATIASFTGGPEYVLSVNANGSTLVNTFRGALGGPLKRFTYNKQTRRLYDGYGNVVDPATGTQIGRFSAQNYLPEYADDLTIDVTGGRIFFLGSNFYPNNTVDIEAFDLNTYTFLNAIAPPGLSGSRIARWGGSGLAVAGGSQIFLIDGTFVNSTGTASNSGLYVGVSPTLTSLSRATAAAGDGPTTVTLSGQNFSQAAVVTWNSLSLPVTWLSSTQISVTLPASALASPVAATFSVTNGSGTESSNALPFVVLPDLGPTLSMTAVPVTGKEMALDPTRDLVYVAVPQNDAQNANSVVTVDPAAAAITSVLPTGRQPVTLDTSSDGKYLYVGYQGLSEIRRYLLADGSLDATIPLTQGPGPQNFGTCVRSAPGQNQTIGVSMNSPNTFWPYVGALAVFDGVTPRQNSLPITNATCRLTWAGDTTRLVQGNAVYLVDSTGVASSPAFPGTLSASIPHYDRATGLAVLDDGSIFDPTTGIAAGVLTSVGPTAVDGPLNRAFVLGYSSAPTSSARYVLDIFDFRRETLLNSLSIPALSGNPIQMLRWGSQGLAILTDTPGMLYLLQGSAISGLVAPPPQAITLNPAKVLVGTAPGTSVTVTGTGFQASSAVLVDGVPQPTTFVSSTQLSFQLTAAQQAIARFLAISVSNTTGGQSSTPDAALEIDNPAPAIASVTPSLVPLGTSSSLPSTITITGSGFMPFSVASFNGSPRATTFVSPTSVTVALFASDVAKIASGQLTVTTSGPGGGTSNPATVQIGNPLPVVSSVSPSTLFAGTGTQPIVLSGSGFNSATVVTVNGSPTIASNTPYSISFTLPASLVARPGTLSIVATNPAPGGGSSAPATITITDAGVGPISISPSTVVQGSNPAAIAVNGTNFIPSSVVLVNGQSRPTTYTNSTQLAFRLAPADLASVAKLNVSVANPVAGGGISPPASLQVAAATSTPVITSVYPTSLATNVGDLYLQVNGTSIAPGTSILWNGAPLPNTYGGNTPSSVSTFVPGNLLTAPGTATITLSSPTASPSTSNAVTVNLVAPAAPTVRSVSPLSGPLNTAFTASITGTNFTQTSVVAVNGTPVPTTFSDTTSLTASVPANLVLLGNDQITVSTPAPGGGTSAALVYTAYVPQVSNSMLYNPANGLLYISVPGSAGAPYGNSVVSVDPLTGALGAPIFVGSEPDHMALTSDGRFLWVALDGASAVRNVDLSTGTAGFQFPIPVSQRINTPISTALAAIPGQTDSVAVANSNGITIYDSGVPRPKVATIPAQGLQIDPVKGEIYAAGQIYYDVYTYDSTGLTRKASTSSSESSFFPGADDRLQLLNGRVYSDFGFALDAETGAQAGNFTGPQSNATTVSPNAAVSVALDVPQNLAFALDSTQQYASFPNQIQVFNLSDFSPATTSSIPANVVPYTYVTQFNPITGLTRWGANGLAFRSGLGIFSLRSNLVKDLSSANADLAVTLATTGPKSTGAMSIYTARITNNGPSTASEVLITLLPPSTGVVSSVSSTAGACTQTSVPACNLGSLASVASATVTMAVNQLSPGASTATAQVTATQADPYLTNNQVSTTATISGVALNPTPSLTALSPSTVLAGSSDALVTLTGSGFNANSVALLDGSPLPTTVVSASQLTAAVPQSSLASLGWHALSVASPAPGGGSSQTLPLTVYSILRAGANHIVYDPFSRNLIATVGPQTPSGNALQFIAPDTGTFATPIYIGSEPSSMALSDDGEMLYVMLNGVNRLQRFNMLTQQPEFSLPLSLSPSSPTSPQFVVQPGSENTLAISPGGFSPTYIADFNPVTHTATPGAANSGSQFVADPVFLDPANLLLAGTYNVGTPAISDYSLTSTGLGPLNPARVSPLSDTSALKLAGTLAFSVDGLIADFSTIPARQVGSFPVSLSQTIYNSPGNVAPDPAIGRAFFITSYDGMSSYGASTLNGIAAFDTRTLLAAPFIPLDILGQDPVAQYDFPVDITRWGQDGLAALTSGGNIYLVRGPAVLPQLLQAGSTPALLSPAALQHGSNNAVLPLTGSNFQPGVAVFWNGSYRTTTYIDATHVNILLPAADLTVPGSASLTAANPGSATSAAVALTIN